MEAVGSLGGLPRQSADWLAMTCSFGVLLCHALLDGSQPDLAGAAVDVHQTLAGGCGADEALAAALPSRRAWLDFSS